jgi:Zn-dependent alcohol dehydrogenase
VAGAEVVGLAVVAGADVVGTAEVVGADVVAGALVVGVALGVEEQPAKTRLNKMTTAKQITSNLLYIN